MLKKRITCVLFIVMIFTMAIMGGIDKMNETYKNMDKSTDMSMSQIFKFGRSVLSGAKDVSIFKEVAIEGNGLFQRIIDRKTVEDISPDDKVIKMNDGSLTFITDKILDVDVRAENIIKFNKFLKERSIQGLYIQAPHKTNEYNSQLPKGIINLANETADQIIDKMRGKIDILDIRKEMKNDGINFTDAFFKTDHHWKPETAFYAFTKTADILKNNYGFEISDEILNLDNYNKKILKKWFLGSEGKRVGSLYAGVDDISIISPKFNTNLEMIWPSYGIHDKGKWLDTVVMDNSNEGKNYYNSNPYAMYMGGDRDLQIIKNLNSLNNKKVVIVRDSFGCAFTPFLSLACKELSVIDLRHYEGSLYNYVEENKPDAVIFLFNPTGIQYIR